MAKKNAAAATSRQSAAPPVAYASAMDKIRDELAKANDPWIEFLGEEMTKLLLAHPEWESAILADGKTLKGLYQAFFDRANKDKKGNAYFGIPAVAREIVCGYYGVKADASEGDGTPPPATQAPPLPGEAFGETGQDTRAAPEPTAVDPFDLDALLGVM